MYQTVFTCMSRSIIKCDMANKAYPDKVRTKEKQIGIFQETDDGDKLNLDVMKEYTGYNKILVRDLFKGSKDMIDNKFELS